MIFSGILLPIFSSTLNDIYLLQTMYICTFILNYFFCWSGHCCTTRIISMYPWNFRISCTTGSSLIFWFLHYSAPQFEYLSLSILGSCELHILLHILEEKPTAFEMSTQIQIISFFMTDKRHILVWHVN